MEELRDIRGLQEISWFPLAPGWWFVLAGVILLFLLIVIVVYYRRRPKKLPTWQTDAMDEWSKLQQIQFAKKQDVIYLAELLRRIAMQHHGRESCAGLVGQQWLVWLSTHDPQQFEWEKNGKLLIEVPYLSEDREIDPHQFKLLLIAVRHWIQF